MNLDDARKQVDEAFEALFSSQGQKQLPSIVPEKVTAGKLYEAFVLAKVAENLKKHEGYELVLVNDNSLKLKASHGGVNRRYPHIEVREGGSVVAEIWTDIDFLALSYCVDGGGREPGKGDYHELDIVVLGPGISGRPRHDEIWIGVECKNTTYQKGLLKEILGIRRELSYLNSSKPTRFGKWPRTSVPAEPPSCLLVYSTDVAVREYASPGDTFGIDFYYEELNP